MLAPSSGEESTPHAVEQASHRWRGDAPLPLIPRDTLVDSTQVWAFSAQTRNWTRLVADADEPEVELDNVFSDGVQLAIALLVALVVTGAALRARFRHDDAYDGPPGVQASPYVGVA